MEHYLNQIRRNFARKDRRAAHHESQPTLREMAQDPEVLPEIVRRNLASPGYLEKTRINPVLAMEIDKSNDFEFILHGWMPLPDRSTDVSHQSIHHHGHLLLTSVSPFGPGYESILFQSDFSLDRETGRAILRAERYYRNSLHNLEFIESQTPHIVFYPPAVSVTYALWCPEKSSVAGSLKKNRLAQKYKQQTKSVLKALGLARAAGINVVEYFDFYLAEGAIWALKERVRYPAGDHENFIQNLFHFLQQIGFRDFEFVARLPEPTAAVTRWKSAFLKQEAIPDRFLAAHLGIPQINMNKQDLLKHFELSALQVT